MKNISIGQLNNQRAAQAFCDYLKCKGINAWAEESTTNFVVVIDDQASEDFASAELRDFLSNPNDRKYLDASWHEGDIDNSITKMTKSKIAGLDFKQFLDRAGVMTKTLVFISVAVTLLTGFGSNQELTEKLFIAVPSLYSTGLNEVYAGEIWRLLTPIFLHFMVIHILFNMMWLWDLGGSVERIQSPQFLLFFVVSIGILSNIIQYNSTGHAAFGGMSGVVYGLLGYTWIRSLQLGSSYYLPKSIIILMLGWLLLGYTGFIGPIANVAHLSGLMLGMAYGFAWNNMSGNNWQPLSVTELSGQLDSWQIVDIRDQNSFHQGHIPGAVNLNNDNFQQYISGSDLQKQIVVVCFHGHSSKGAAAVLSNVGFEKVHSLDGGMTAWAVQNPEQVDKS